MFSSRFMPCAECGASVDQRSPEPHTCDPERRASYQMFGLRDDIDAFEPRLREWLSSAQGVFETWLAARDVRARRA
ncbi:MAG: hypothetical protein ACXVW2_12435 [Nocardioidaceae bacterium]